jgi:hypothetical protein
LVPTQHRTTAHKETTNYAPSGAHKKDVYKKPIRVTTRFIIIYNPDFVTDPVTYARPGPPDAHNTPGSPIFLLLHYR